MAILSIRGVDTVTGQEKLASTADTVIAGFADFETALHVGDVVATTNEGTIRAGNGSNLFEFIGSNGVLSTTVSDAVTSTATAGIHSRHSTSATPVAGFGSRLSFDGDDDDNTSVNIAIISGIWSDPSTGAATGDISFTTRSAGTTNVEAMRIRGVDQTLEIVGGLEVGSASTATAAAGDIVAGDGTREMSWDASAGTWLAGLPTGIRAQWHQTNGMFTVGTAVEPSLTSVTGSGVRLFETGIIQCVRHDAGTSDVVAAALLNRHSSGATITAGYGTSLSFSLEKTGTNAANGYVSGNIVSSWESGTAGSNTGLHARMEFQVRSANIQETILILDGVDQSARFSADIEAGAEATTVTIQGVDATTAATAGASLTLSGGDATTTGAGGILNLTGGASPTGTPGTVQVNSLPLPSVLSTTTGVNLDTVSTDALYTVPTGRSAIITEVRIRLTTATAPGGDAVVSVGTNASTFDDIIAATTLTGLNLTTEVFAIITPGLSHIGAAAEVITFQIDTADTGTTVTATVDLIGYLV